MKKNLLLIVITILFSLIQVFGMDFQVSKLITIPGDNTNFDLLKYGYHANASHICWENQNDSLYTIYLKKIENEMSENIIVYSDTIQNIQPQISILDQGIRIVWLSKIENHWRLLQKNYQGDSLDQVSVVVDSLSENANPSMSNNRIVYIKNGNLMLKSFNSECEGYLNPILIDSNNCSNPDIFYDDYNRYASIIYEKLGVNYTEIYRARYSNSKWGITKISNNVNENKNPKYSCNITYESFVDSVWKIVTYECGEYYYSNNKIYNYYNPTNFCYAVPTKGNGYTPCFTAFDSDSLGNNQEIFINTLYSFNDTTINISNSTGYDEKPSIVVVSDSISIIWTHTENGKTDIWWAKDKFNPTPGNVDEKIDISTNYMLNQNFPNPFNASTSFTFSIPNREYVEIAIFDVNGKKVQELFTGIHESGAYRMDWNSESLSSGTYFYQIKTNNYIQSKKCVILK